MTSADPIILYDIAGKDTRYTPWSPNTFKTRYALSYKGLVFKTEWVEFPDIEAVCIKVGGAPTSTKPDGSPYYTLPMIYDPSTKTYVTEAAAIAQYLDKTYPNTPALIPVGTLALQLAFVDSLWDLVGDPFFMYSIIPLYHALSPRSQEYFRVTREQTFGKKLEEIGGNQYLKVMEEGLGKVAGWMSSNGPGKDELILGDGDKISFADTQLAGLLVWARVTLGEDSEDWKKIASWNDSKWKNYVEYFDKYSSSPA